MWLTELAGLRSTNDLEKRTSAEQIAFTLRIDVDQWLAICYLQVKGGRGFRRRQFFGQQIAADRLNFGWPRICPNCLQERGVWWGIWDLAFVCACPKHQCLLVNRCLGCGKALTWHRPGVNECRCGFDLGRCSVVAAENSVLALTAAIYEAAHFPFGTSKELAAAHFPLSLSQLNLDQLLGLVLAIGSTNCGQALKQSSFRATDISGAAAVCKAAGLALRDWPAAFRETLNRIMAANRADPAQLTFQRVFGSFYQYYLKVYELPEFRFLRDAFESFVIEDWKGLVRGQHRAFSPATRTQFRWIPAQQAANAASVRSTRVAALVRRSIILGLFVQPANAVQRTECWVDRDSLSKWIAHRDSELASFMPQEQATQALGLTPLTLKSVATRGLIRRVEGTDQDFAAGTYYSREDIAKILGAFEKMHSPARDQYHSGGLMSLRDAVRLHLGRSVGLSSLIQAVMDGAVKPAGRLDRAAGISGYLFRTDEIRKYRSIAVPNAIQPDGYVTYKEASAIIGETTEVVRNLAANQILRRSELRSCGAVMVCRDDVENFARTYVSVRRIADRFHTKSEWVARYLKGIGIEILTIQLPGKGKKLFVTTKSVAGITIPPAKRAKRKQKSFATSAT